MCHLTFSLPRQLAHLICGRLISHIIYCLQTKQSLGFIPNKKIIRFELSSAIHLYRFGIPDTTQYSQSTTRSYGIHTLDNQTISNSDSSFSSLFPFSFGETQCCSRFSVLLDRLHLRPLQMCLLSVWDLIYLLWIIKFQFVCVEVLQPSQPNRVMSSAVSLPNHTFTGQA